MVHCEYCETQMFLPVFTECYDFNSSFSGTIHILIGENHICDVCDDLAATNDTPRSQISQEWMTWIFLAIPSFQKFLMWHKKSIHDLGTWGPKDWAIQYMNSVQAPLGG